MAMCMCSGSKQLYGTSKTRAWHSIEHLEGMQDLGLHLKDSGVDKLRLHVVELRLQLGVKLGLHLIKDRLQLGDGGGPTRDFTSATSGCISGTSAASPRP